ncbi:MAG: hypothetical protein JNM42_07165 [Propionivibrio sp.]|uniref:hypothetical protein n=1 Tax=Propionivibrio sp. TaxID=2212460 RepID=UPI001A5C4E39|nr:hypothetical protein [Propionivibrio sp.]MBL8414198.1 hypothetical protein [Propionivibrio sp.]
MEIEMTKLVPVNVKTVKLHMKVCDRFECAVYDQDNKQLKDYEGYVPDFMPGQHYGDYVILDIDVDTGHITNWKTPSAEQMQEFINADA